MRNSASLLASLLLLGAGVTLQAQDRPAQMQPPVITDSKACAPGDRLQPGAGELKAPQGTTGESLSEKLARTDGVICPPNVDPGIKAPTPEAGKTPVIPPPGSPGGDPTVQPK